MSYPIKEKHRKRMRNKIVVGAKKYKNFLIGKDFMVICEDGSTHDARFFSKDFIHLTGVLSDLDDERFFENSCAGTLAVGNILEEQKYNWDNLRNKTDRIEIIDQIIYGNTTNSLFMINLHTKTRDYPIAIRNSDMNTCIGFTDDIHRARSLRKYTNSNDADAQRNIIAIFGKRPNENIYGELVYIKNNDLLLEKKSDISQFVTEDIKTLLKPTEQEMENIISSDVILGEVETEEQITVIKEQERSETPVEAEVATEQELLQVLSKSEADVEAGNVAPIQETFDNICEEMVTVMEESKTEPTENDKWLMESKHQLETGQVEVHELEEIEE